MPNITKTWPKNIAVIDFFWFYDEIGRDASEERDNKVDVALFSCINIKIIIFKYFLSLLASSIIAMAVPQHEHSARLLRLHVVERGALLAAAVPIVLEVDRVFDVPVFARGGRVVGQVVARRERVEAFAAETIFGVVRNDWRTDAHAEALGDHDVLPEAFQVRLAALALGGQLPVQEFQGRSVQHVTGSPRVEDQVGVPVLLKAPAQK